jgi:hypothetical protein
LLCVIVVRPGRVLVEDLVHPFRWASNYGLVTMYDDGTIHHFGMFHQQSDQSIGRVVIIYIETEFGKGARMQHFFGFDREQFEKIPELALTQRVLYIFDNVELDVAVAQDILRTV